MGCLQNPPRKKKHQDEDTSAKRKPITSNEPKTTDKKQSADKQKESIRPSPSPYKQMTEETLISQYILDELVNNCSTLEGPRVIVNRSTGESRVLRILNRNCITQKRVVGFKQLMGAEIYEMESDIVLFISKLCTGCTVLEYFVQGGPGAGTEVSRVLQQIYNILVGMHEKGIYHGNLSLESFRFVSKRSSEMVLVQPNFNDKGEDLFSNLHKNTQQSDWEFFGALLSILLEGKVPQYSRESLQYRNIANSYILTFLQGRRDKLPPAPLPVSSKANIQQCLVAYQYRISIYKFLKLKTKGNKKRLESRYLYDQETNSQINWNRPVEDQRARIERNRITTQIKKALEHDPGTQVLEEFWKLGMGGPKIQEFGQILKIAQAGKRYQEAMYKLSTIVA